MSCRLEIDTSTPFGAQRMGGEQDPPLVGTGWFPGITPEDFGAGKAWLDDIISPALIVNEAHVRHNVKTIIGKCGRPDRWRPHLKTTKMKWVWRILIEEGVRNFKVATTKEAEAMIQLVREMKSLKDTVDVLVAYPLVGPNLRALGRLTQTPGASQIKLSVLVECDRAIDDVVALDCGIGVFIDINPGMDRTGLAYNRDGEAQHSFDDVRELIIKAKSRNVFRGIHYYEGHISECLAERDGLSPNQSILKEKLDSRESDCFRCYNRWLLPIFHESLKDGKLPGCGGIKPEIITSGTPGFTHALRYELFLSGMIIISERVLYRYKQDLRGLPVDRSEEAKLSDSLFHGIHRVSPGTVVFHDWRGERQNPGLGLKPAAVVMARVVSNPRAGMVTLDCGSKSIAAEAGDPAGYVIGYPEVTARSCSEEHMPCSVAELADSSGKRKRGATDPWQSKNRGEVCFVVPEHICPTVNLADEVVVIREVSSEIEVRRVDARGHHLRLEDIQV